MTRILGNGSIKFIFLVTLGEFAQPEQAIKIMQKPAKMQHTYLMILQDPIYDFDYVT